MRMSSVDLPDDHDKSLSSASVSPCPSPVSIKHQRLLPSNLYVCLYHFSARQPDELELRAGYKITATDTSDPDWWRGKCLGRLGYFPSAYVTRLCPGERPLRVLHNLELDDGGRPLQLLRDQIVIQVGKDVDSFMPIRNGENRRGMCPVKYLQDV